MLTTHIILLILGLTLVIIGATIVMKLNLKQNKDVWIVLLLTIGGYLFALGVVSNEVWFNNYKQGQIDAINGKIVYEMRVQSVYENNRLVSTDTTYVRIKK